MKWNNLKNNKCPKCFGLLTQNTITGLHECLGCNDFTISEEKFDKIVNDMYRPNKFQNEDERLEELNNFGREKVTQDFSDSPVLDN